nr:proteoglycan 4-like [Danaus plexippus plexippus]
MMFLIVILGVIASSLALPVIPDPPSLPNGNVSALHHLNFHTRNVKPFKSTVQKDKENDVKINSYPVLPTRKQTAKGCIYLQKQLYELQQELKKTNQEIKNENNSVENKNNNCEDVTEQYNNCNDETEKVNVKVNLVAVPPAPTLAPFDYSTLKRQKYVHKQQPETTTEKIYCEDVTEQDNNCNDETEKENVEVNLVAVPPAPTLAPFDYSTLKRQKYVHKKQPETTTEKIYCEDVTEQDNNCNDETEKENVEVNLVAVPPAPTLAPFDYSTLKRQKYVHKKQPETTTEKIYCEDVTEQDNNCNDETEKENVEVNLVAVPPAPTLAPFDYSTLKRQKYVHKKQPETTTEKIYCEDVTEQDNNCNDETEKENVEVNLVAVPPAPTLAPFDYSTLKRQKYVHKKQPETTTEKIYCEDVTEQDNNCNDETEKENVEVNLVAVPPAPTLAPFDYSTLKRQKYVHKKQPETTTEKIYCEDVTEQDNNCNDETEKENVEVNLVAVPPAPTLAPFDYSTLKRQKYVHKKQPETTTEKIYCEDVTEQDNNCNDETEKENVEVNLVAVPPAPTLAPFDYSTLKRQKYFIVFLAAIALAVSAQSAEQRRIKAKELSALRRFPALEYEEVHDKYGHDDGELYVTKFPAGLDGTHMEGNHLPAALEPLEPKED